MAIPGMRPKFDVRAKVRIGVKGKTAGGKEFPKSVDYFVCDDPDFQRVCGEKPKELTILLPFQTAADNFSTGLEQWAGAMLVCYTKGEQVAGKTAAFRKATMKKGGREVNLLEGFNVLGDAMGNDRRPVECLARECPMMQAKDGCKPMGRLQFFIKGINPALGIYQLDTKSWNTIEGIEGFLSILGDPRGQELTLSVEMWSKGTSKFPVVSLKGATVQVETETDVAIADQLVLLHKALGVGDEAAIKEQLALSLDLSNPGWRSEQPFIDRIKEIGATEAAKGLLRKFEL